MKDVTSTSFGLIIALLLPGLGAFYTLSLWSTPVAELFRTFLSSQSTGGLFVLVITTALDLGLFVSVFRWFIFELWLCKGDNLNESDFAQLRIKANLKSYQAAIDEDYRYHQFWGSMAVILPFFYAGLLKHYWTFLDRIEVIISVPVFIGVQYVIGRSAMAAYKSFMARVKPILKKESRILKGE